MEYAELYPGADIPRCAHKFSLCMRLFILRLGHTDRVGGMAWHPQATLSQSEDAVNMVSGAADLTVNLWSLNRSVLCTRTSAIRLIAPLIARRPWPQ